MKYLIAGTGGVGGSIAGFLSLAGKDVTCIARGAHLQSIQTNGLKLKSDLKGEHTLQIKATTAEEFKGKADVIFVCVKGYSVDSITELIKRASHEKTVVIPILNVYGTGPRIQRLVPGVTVLDGCIYIAPFHGFCRFQFCIKPCVAFCCFQFLIRLCLKDFLSLRYGYIHTS